MSEFDYKFWLPIISSAFAVWYTYNRTSKIESLKNQHQKKLHIYKEQFNKEYTVYVNIWEHIVELRRAYYVLHNLRTFANSNAFDANLLNEGDFHSHLSNFIQSFNKLVHEMEIHKPFYDYYVYSEIEVLGNYLGKEIELMKKSKGNFEEYKNKSKAGFKKFEGLYEKVSISISETIKIDENRE